MHKGLTHSQEVFVDCILQGKNQYQAYITAYPKAKNWKRNAADSNASQLLNKPKIKAILDEYGFKQEQKILWTRQKALETISYVMDMNKQDMERINQAYDDEIQLLNAQLLELANALPKATTKQQAYSISKDMQAITAQIALRNKQRRANSVNAHGIYEGAKILNRMFGYDITKVEINTQDEEREEMEKLSAEELKELINISKKENE